MTEKYETSVKDYIADMKEIIVDIMEKKVSVTEENCEFFMKLSREAYRDIQQNRIADSLERIAKSLDDINSNYTLG